MHLTTKMWYTFYQRQVTAWKLQKKCNLSSNVKPLFPRYANHYNNNSEISFIDTQLKKHYFFSMGLCSKIEKNQIGIFLTLNFKEQSVWHTSIQIKVDQCIGSNVGNSKGLGPRSTKLLCTEAEMGWPQKCYISHNGCKWNRVEAEGQNKSFNKLPIFF